MTETTVQRRVDRLEELEDEVVEEAIRRGSTSRP